MFFALAAGMLYGQKSDTRFFHVRLVLSCFIAVASCGQMFNCSRDFVTLVFLTGGLFL